MQSKLLKTVLRKSRVPEQVSYLMQVLHLYLQVLQGEKYHFSGVCSMQAWKQVYHSMNPLLSLNQHYSPENRTVLPVA